jgi:amino acid permease
MNWTLILFIILFFIVWILSIITYIYAKDRKTIRDSGALIILSPILIVIFIYLLITENKKQEEKQISSKKEPEPEPESEPIQAPEPMQEPFCEAFGSTEFTSDVRDVNNKNYQGYIFGGKIEK